MAKENDKKNPPQDPKDPPNQQDPPAPDESQIVEKKTIVAGKKVVFKDKDGREVATVKIAADEKVLTFTVYPDRVAYYVEGPHGGRKCEVKR